MQNPFEKILSREEHVCPWWFAYTFDNPLRRILHDPVEIFRGLVEPGQTVIDIGCGMGYFTLGLARIVGDKGKVIAVDLQEQMLKRVKRRAERAGLFERIRLHQCTQDSIGLSDQADFVLSFWMVHETGDRAGFLRQVRGLMKPQAHYLMAEPRMHVSAAYVRESVEIAQAAGLEVVSTPKIRWSRAVLFKRRED